MDSVTTLEIPARSVYVGVVRLALASLARVQGLDEDRIEDIRMAVSEACANAVLANEASGTPVTVSWQSFDDRVEIEVAQRGSAPGEADSAAGKERLAMSVALLRSLVDECAFEPGADGRVTTRLTIRT